MGGEEIEHGAKHRRITHAGAQFVRGKPGEREQAFGPALALEEPAEGLEGEGLRIGRG